MKSDRSTERGKMERVIRRRKQERDGETGDGGETQRQKEMERPACKVRCRKKGRKRWMRERGEKTNIQRNADRQKEIGFY